MKFKFLVDVFEKLSSKSGRIEMAQILSELFKASNPKEVKEEIYLIQGILAPPHKGINLGLGDRFSLEVIAITSGYSFRKVENEYKRLGDLGETAYELIKKKKQISLFKEPLELDYVFNTFLKIAKLEGEKSQSLKKRSLSNLLNNASPLEAKYIMRFVVGELRLGVGDSTIMDAISMALTGDKSLKEKIERAYNLCNDLGHVGELSFEDFSKIEHFKISVFTPIRPALAERLPTEKEIIEKLGKCAVEFKFDGFRMQVHKKGGVVKIYSRRLEDITRIAPDIVEDVKSLPVKEIIFEGEALAFNEKENRFYSFQETMHRRRKYGIKEAAKKYPLYLYVFDIMYLNGKSLVDLPYKKRRIYLEKIFPYKSLHVSKKWIIKSEEELEKKFLESMEKGLEGVMAKDLNAPYTAGARKFAWIKLKKSYGKSMDTVDGVIVGYYLGKGSRAEFKFGGLLIAVYNDITGQYETIAKVGSGYSEEMMKELEKKLSKIKIKKPENLAYKIEPDYWVKMKYVVEVAFDNITKSSVHTCYEKDGKGYALRFPRLVRIRTDKGIKDVTTSREIHEMYLNQI